ncbi:MAG: formate dehydrogenase accessory sulfurtransferase FdhD, partial [Desulfofustis sp.]|nr:formate dehydrogenase accessory sulfurtransferase FdhD [Desulfofustis sp.]
MADTTSLVYDTTIVTPKGKTREQESVALETPYTIMLNEVEIGASMVLPMGLEEFGVGFLFGQGYIERREEIKEVLVCPEGKISVYADVENTEPKDVIITSGCGGTGKIPREMLEGVIAEPLDYSLPFTELKPLITQVYQASPLGPLTHCVHG